jgi:nitroreductase
MLNNINYKNMIELKQAIQERHAVRSFQDRKIEKEILSQLSECIDEVNSKGHINAQLVLDEPQAFSGMKAHYGKFSGVNNYIAMVGPKGGDTAESIGYWGEHIVLKAQQLGLNTCWVGLTYSKVRGAYKITEKEKLYIVIAIGYGVSHGVNHKIKAIEAVSQCDVAMPDWFRKGVETALLAPTSMNQQKFKFILQNGKVSVHKGIGFYTNIDLGIVKYHFEIGSGVKL